MTGQDVLLLVLGLLTVAVLTGTVLTWRGLNRAIAERRRLRVSYGLPPTGPTPRNQFELERMKAEYRQGRER